MIILPEIFYRKEKEEPLNDSEKMALQRENLKHILTSNQLSKSLT